MQLGIAKYVRVAKNKLSRYPRRDIVDREITLFSSDGGVKNDLEQQISELFDQMRRVARFLSSMDSVKRFVRLFKQVLRK